MIAGRGTPDQGPAHALKAADRATFAALIDLLTEATIDYLSAQVLCGGRGGKTLRQLGRLAEGPGLRRIRPCTRAADHRRAEGAPPRPAHHRLSARGGAGAYVGFARATGADCVALDNSVSAEWAATHVQCDSCVQGNLAPHHMVTGGPAMEQDIRRIVHDPWRRAPHLQSGPRDHTGRRPRQCRTDDRSIWCAADDGGLGRGHAGGGGRADRAKCRAGESCGHHRHGRRHAGTLPFRPALCLPVPWASRSLRPAKRRPGQMPPCWVLP